MKCWMAKSGLVGVLVQVLRRKCAESRIGPLDGCSGLRYFCTQEAHRRMSHLPNEVKATAFTVFVLLRTVRLVLFEFAKALDQVRYSLLTIFVFFQFFWCHALEDCRVEQLHLLLTMFLEFLFKLLNGRQSVGFICVHRSEDMGIRL